MFHENKTAAGIALNDSSIYLFTPFSKDGVKLSREKARAMYERLCDSEEEGTLTAEEYDILGCLNVLIRVPVHEGSSMEALVDIYRFSTFFDCGNVHIIHSHRYGFYCAPSNPKSQVDLHRAMELQHRLNKAFKQ